MSIKCRQNPIDSVEPEEVESALGAIAKHFRLSWLEEAGGEHELQLLWNRRDALSTVELFTFGQSLIAAERIDPKWVKHQKSLIQGKDSNNRKGAFFELLAVGYLAERQEVVPAPANRPGYDLTVKVADSHQVCLSLKCYSASAHERAFQKKANIAREKFVKSTVARRYQIQIFVEALTYPGESEWQKLYSAIPKFAASFYGKAVTWEVDGAWMVTFVPLTPSAGETFSNAHSSYTFICIAPHHRNEQQNFISKLESAISNIEKHTLNNGCFPWVLMRLPPTACSKTMEAWAQEYLDGLANPKVLAISFIQPYLVVEGEKGASYVAHYAGAAVSLPLITKTESAMGFNIPVGTITQQPPKWQLNGGGGYAPLENRYIYQRGEHYVMSQLNGGAMECNVTHGAPGVEKLCVFDINGDVVVIRGRWGDDLLVIGG